MIRAPRNQARGLAVGLFLITLATLLLELLIARLLSVLTWYHLSFLAVSLAMLGMAGGAVFVFRRGERAMGGRAQSLVCTAAIGFAISIPIAHFALLRIPLHGDDTIELIRVFGVAIALLTAPFFFSGIAVTLCLTRLAKNVGRLYAWDLAGAATGCALMVPLLEVIDVTAATLFCSAVGGAAACAFARLVPRRSRVAGVTAVLLLCGFGIWVAGGRSVPINRSKGIPFQPEKVAHERWNSHSHVVIRKPVLHKPFLWGAGSEFGDVQVETAMITIDGCAGTPITRWSGDPEDLGWIPYDVTSLPYQIRSGDVAVIGVGGGRDVLAALWSGADSVTGIELNGSILDLLRGPYREFSSLADHPRVTLVHDEARSYLTRSDRTFDLVQMSLIDTWASTAAGAFTLSENTLYTVEAWSIFLERLRPAGVLSVSRWFSPGDVSETNRLTALAAATLHEAGISEPFRHVILVARGLIATMLLSKSPFSPGDVTAIERAVERYGFELLATPNHQAENPRLRAILASSNRAELLVATDHPHFDYGAPTDRKPYFFNMLKLSSFHRVGELGIEPKILDLGGVVSGNIKATTTLMSLLILAFVYAKVLIIYPLVRGGLPDIAAGTLATCLGYFAAIGYGFMSIQIALLGTLGPFLGHPVYALSVVLFSMILFAGIGSALSDRVVVESGSAPIAVPIGVAALIVGFAMWLPDLLASVISYELPGRIFLAIVVIAPVSILLGYCFPFGIRLAEPHSREIGAWAWGINGAFGVVAAVAAVGVSLWAGIDANFYIAASLYVGVAIAGGRLRVQG